MGAFTNILLPDRGSGEGEMTEAVFSWGEKKIFGCHNGGVGRTSEGVFGY
jgi:hypothetical protein